MQWKSKDSSSLKRKRTCYAGWDVERVCRGAWTLDIFNKMVNCGDDGCDLNEEGVALPVLWFSLWQLLTWAHDKCLLKVTWVVLCRTC